MYAEVMTISNLTITTCNKTICSTSWDEGYDKHELTHIYFGLGIVTQFIIACVGLSGNSLSILIFTSRELRSTFHMLLVVLATFDSSCLILIILEKILKTYDFFTQGTVFPDPKYKPSVLFFYLYPKLIRPFEFIFILASEYCTVIMSLDRYYAVVYPLQYYSKFSTNYLDTSFLEQNRDGTDEENIRCTGVKVCWQRVIGYSTLSFIFAFCYNIPIFFEVYTMIENGNKTMDMTPWYNSEIYALTYYVILDGLCKFFIPGCILIYTNSMIYGIIMKQANSTSEYARYKRTQYVMLFGVVILLMVTNIYRFCANIHNFTIQDYLDCCPTQKDNLVAVMVGSALRTVNISANCFIYISTSNKFRKILLRKMKSSLNPMSNYI